MREITRFVRSARAEQVKASKNITVAVKTMGTKVGLVNRAASENARHWRRAMSTREYFSRKHGGSDIEERREAYAAHFFRAKRNASQPARPQ